MNDEASRDSVGAEATRGAGEAHGRRPPWGPGPARAGSARRVCVRLESGGAALSVALLVNHDRHYTSTQAVLLVGRDKRPVSGDRPGSLQLPKGSAGGPSAPERPWTGSTPLTTGLKGIGRTEGPEA